MSIHKTAPIPLSTGGAGKRDLRTQFAALCYRLVQGKPQILLITSRTTHRWIIPKGWPLEGETPAEAAGTEAWEEAGAEGKMISHCIGLYSYTKTGEGDETDLPCVVAVFPMKVKSLAKDYPERSERRRRWFSPKQAAKKVQEPELREILRTFDPKILG